MKRMNKLLLFAKNAIAAIICACAAMLMFSCDNINSMHEEYLNRGEGIYIGAADSVQAYSGYRKIQLKWKINADPRIDKAIIYWDKRAQNVTVPINREASEGEMWMEAILEDMQEIQYIFEIEMQDNTGLVSLPVEVIGAALGDTYLESLYSRVITNIRKLANGDISITWADVNSATLQYTEVHYTDDNGQQRTGRVYNYETGSVFEGLKSGDEIEVISFFEPENSFEHFSSPKRNYFIPSLPQSLDKSMFNHIVLAGDNTTTAGGRPLPNLWDDNMTGLWVTDIGSVTVPWTFTLDIGVVTKLSHFVIFCRDGYYYTQQPRYFSVWGTDELKEGVNNNDPYYATDDWKDDWTFMGDFELEKPSGLPGSDYTPSDLDFYRAGFTFNFEEYLPAVKYLRFEIQSVWGGGVQIVLAEIYIYDR